jgi:hypothetical protein
MLPRGGGQGKTQNGFNLGKPHRHKGLLADLQMQGQGGIFAHRFKP